MPDRTVERREGDGPLDPLIFASFARWVERQLGRSTAFVLAILGVGLWAVTGPFFGWSDTWQLVINTGTTIVTFLMVFVIQNTQSRDTQAMQLKLDELIRVNDDQPPIRSARQNVLDRGSRKTHCWREMDSNHRSPVRKIYANTEIAGAREQRGRRSAGE